MWPGMTRKQRQSSRGLIEEIGFAALDTGSLHEGGRLQQPDSPIYNKTYNAREARQFLSSLTEKRA